MILKFDYAHRKLSITLHDSRKNGNIVKLCTFAKLREANIVDVYIKTEFEATGILLRMLDSV